MKKTLLHLLLSIIAVTALFGITAVVAENTVINDSNRTDISSDIYEVVYFAPPYRTIYSLSEVETTEYIDENGKKQISQYLPFDGTGMSITVKNIESGRVKNYNYNCEYFELDGETLRYEDPISFFSDPSDKYRYTPGEHTISAVLTTDDNELVVHDFTYTLVDDSNSDTDNALTKTPTQNTTQDSDSEESESDSLLILPDIRGTWEHETNAENCKIEITEQHGSNLELSIAVANERGTQVAISVVNVTIDKLFEQDDVIYAEGDFIYIDSYKNGGTGKITVSKDSLTIDFTQEHNSGRGWSILKASGNYTPVED